MTPCSVCGRTIAGGTPSVAGKPVHYECYRAAYEANGGVTSPMMIEIDRYWQAQAAERRAWRAAQEAQQAAHRAQLDALVRSGARSANPHDADLGAPGEWFDDARYHRFMDAIWPVHDAIQTRADWSKRHQHAFGYSRGVGAERDALLACGWTGGDPSPRHVEAFLAHLEQAAEAGRQAWRNRSRRRPAASEAAAHAVAARPAAPPAATPQPAAPETTFGAVAPTLWRNGYLPLPLRPGDKAPVLTGWQAPLEIDDAVARRHADCGCGILTAISPAADVDVRDPAAVADLRILVREMLGDTPLLRVGQPPKFAAVYRADQPFRKVTGRQLVLPGDDADADGYAPHRVEILADGQQLAAYAVHPATGRPYAWSPSDPLRIPLADLPAIDQQSASAFVDAAEALLIEHHGAIPVRQQQRAWRRDDRPRGQRRPRDPANWWWLHAVPFDDLAGILELATSGHHVLRGKVKRWSQSSLATRCPNHKGAHGNSLNFARAPDGRVLFHCHAGCDPEDVAEAISEILRAQFEADLADLARRSNVVSLALDRRP